MAIINKRFIYFDTLAEFEYELNLGNILNTSLVFIRDILATYLNGGWLSKNTIHNLEELSEQLKESIELLPTDTVNEAIVKLYNKVKDVDGNADEIIKILISEIHDLEQNTNAKIDEYAEITAAALNDKVSISLLWNNYNE